MTDLPLLPDDSPEGLDDRPLPSAMLAVAREYNRPPDAVPVTEILAAVEARLAARAARPRVIPLHRRPAVQAVFALAATLVVGFGIGRFTEGRMPGMSRSGGAMVAAASGTTGTNGTTDAASIVVQVAAREHLARTEALLTAFRAEAAAGRSAGDLGAWARDLLSETRLLLDSPAAHNPRERMLLEEIELLLSAVSQASASRRASDTELLTEQLRRRNVIPRLRAIQAPLGPSAAGAMSLPITE
jgi:hypothetical protein